ncbi:homologous-pairing protein 2 homolog isoform X3 [Tamandua tetradactyla]|uniref:homologous-pairing protein 2 homolog isoform X3 n=1 Tax=Tamandua tetradactyla TaxID=48850 RepID=UPI0040548E86
MELVLETSGHYLLQPSLSGERRERFKPGQQKPKAAGDYGWMSGLRPESNAHFYGVPEGSVRSGRLTYSQSLVEALPSRFRKKLLPRATTTSGVPSLAAGKAMSKGRAEAAAGAPGLVLRYLKEQNRPYSAQDVFGNLQREHGLGKADQFDMVSDADLQGLDAKIVALTAKVQSLQQSCRHMEAELKELSSALTTPEMQKEVQELKKECAGYTDRLKNIKAATNHVTPEEKEQVYRERQKYCKEWRKRKRMATELSDAILEGYPKNKKQFFVSLILSLPCSLGSLTRDVSFVCLPALQEEVGIETDEDYSVTLPDP